MVMIVCIMVVIDKFSKRAHFIPTTSTMSAQGIAQLFFDTVWKAHGLPTKIISDRDSKFTKWILANTLEALRHQIVNVHRFFPTN